VVFKCFNVFFSASGFPAAGNNLLARNKFIMMISEQERQQCIDEITRIRNEMGMAPYDRNYLDSLSTDELEKLYARHDTYLRPIKAKKSNKLWMTIPAIIVVCLIIAILVFNPFKEGWGVFPGSGNAKGTGGAGERPDFRNITACMCDAEPGVCEPECYCDPMCANGTG
jgi:hypothetical protein